MIFETDLDALVLDIAVQCDIPPSDIVNLFVRLGYQLETETKFQDVALVDSLIRNLAVEAINARSALKKLNKRKPC